MGRDPKVQQKPESSNYINRNNSYFPNLIYHDSIDYDLKIDYSLGKQ